MDCAFVLICFIAVLILYSGALGDHLPGQRKRHWNVRGLASDVDQPAHDIALPNNTTHNSLCVDQHRYAGAVFQQ